MFFWLHNYQPSAVLATIGPLKIYWYGLIIALAIVAAAMVAIKLARCYHIKKELLWDLFFYLVIFGLIGDRLVDVFLYDWGYFSQHLWEIPQIWHGGMAIHGALLFGLVTLWIYTRRKKLSFWLLGDILMPVVAIGQAIGRWGNYFNQEIFGRPTDLPWGIPIDWLYRPAGYENFTHFQPLFLYESLGCLALGLILLGWHWWRLKRPQWRAGNILIAYLVGYAILRFSLEFLRLDAQPALFGLRTGQWLSALLLVLAVGLWGARRHQKQSLPPAS